MQKIISRYSVQMLASIISLLLTPGLMAAAEVKNDAPVAIIDTHTHILRGYGKMQKRGEGPSGAPALQAMDKYGIAMAILLPPPFPPNHPGVYGLSEIEPVVRRNQDRFGFAAGGESLNPMIQRTPPD